MSTAQVIAVVIGLVLIVACVTVAAVNSQYLDNQQRIACIDRGGTAVVMNGSTSCLFGR